MFFGRKGMNNDLDRESVFEQLKIDEGVVYEVYHDHLGLPTFGVGHLVLESDPEHGKPLGTPVDEDRVKDCFEKDLDTAISECEVLYEDHWEGFPGEVKEILVNMMFNMGRTRLSGFKNFKKALRRKRNWKQAGIEGQRFKVV